METLTYQEARAEYKSAIFTSALKDCIVHVQCPSRQSAEELLEIIQRDEGYVMHIHYDYISLIHIRGRYYCPDGGTIPWRVHLQYTN